MSALVEDVKFKVKQAGSGLVVWLCKFVTGLFLGITIALAGEEIAGYGALGLIFVVLLCVGTFLKIAKKWSITTVIVFNLICVLLGLLLRMYILMAPGV